MLLARLTCSRCREDFETSLDVYKSLDYDTLPKRCPKCCDQLQERPDVVLERQTLVEFTCVVDQSFLRLVHSMTEFQPLETDTPSHRVTVKGKWFGVVWHGRIDLYSHVWPIEEGVVVTMALNQVKRKVWYVERSRWIAGMTLNARQVTTTRRVPRDYQPAEGESIGVREEENEYVVLLPSSEQHNNQLPRLCWLEAYSKTTLKGFGRQFRADIVGGKPLWSQSVHGRCRSGRYGTTAMLAVCDQRDMPRVETKDI